MRYDAFLSYAREDIATVKLVADRLTAAGAKVFFDKSDLRAGEAWKLAIPKAIRRSKTFIAFLSRASVRKAGYVQAEIIEALEVVRSLPPDRIFVIPLRLEPCKPRHPMLHQFTWVDLFDGFEEAIIRILRVVKPRAARVAEARNIETISRPVRSVPPSATSGAFQTALALRPAHEVDEIELRLDVLRKSSSVAHNAVVNLLAEANLPIGVMEELVAAIFSSPADTSALKHAISNVSRRHFLKGPRAAIDSDAALTRVISLDRFVDHLYASHVAGTPAIARAMVRRAIEQNIPPRDWANNIPLGRYMIWAVVSADGRTPPLSPAMSRREVLDVLGLPSHRAGEPLLAISYRLPEAVIPKVPTFCDAYVSEFWPYLFRVPAQGAPYGLTVPRDESGQLAGLPEVVHQSITLDHADSMIVLA